VIAGQYNIPVWMKLGTRDFCSHGGFCPFQRFAYRGFNSQSRGNAGTEVTLPLGQARLAPAAGIPACKRSDDASSRHAAAIADRDLRIADLKRRFPRELAEVLVTAHDVSPEWHVRVQAAFQSHIDSAVSKTVNLPEDATVADVDKTFRLAYELGCKGITVFRDRSCDAQTFTAAGSLRRTAPGSDKRRAPANRATSAERVGLPVSGDTACPVCERHSPNELGVTKNTACGVAEDGAKQRTRTQPATRRRQALRRALKSSTARTGYG